MSNTITYKGQQYALNENTFFMNGALDYATVAKQPYVCNDIRELVKRINARGDKAAVPITVYIAPYVYWIDDPDATDVVQCREGEGMPFGLKVTCDALKLVGLGEKPEDVVLAGNRGQSHGANGNYTMFCFLVRDLELTNLTMGNYCSIDLEYAKDSRLNRSRRTAAITQAQLAWQRGDKLLARDCNFVGRLNLLPVCGGERCLYENCHFESTDDALNGRAVYLNCDFDFYANRPFYSTRESGAVFLHCLFRSRITEESMERTQYFTKEGGQVTVVDCEYVRLGQESKEKVDWNFGWTRYPKPSLRCYQSCVWYHEEPVQIGGEGASNTVHMEGKEIENAYRLETEGRVIYNTYNLLRGKDDWDPLQVKDIVRKAGKEAIPTRLTIKASGEKVIAGESVVALEATASYFYGEWAWDVQIAFTVSEADRAYVQLTDKGNGCCVVEGITGEDLPRTVLVSAVTPQGLEAAVQLEVCPSLWAAPVFIEQPKMELSQGSAKINYRLDTQGYEDCSQVLWYRCKQKDGSDGILVTVSHSREILQSYALTEADVGYYLMAQVVPCHVCSRKGTPVCAVSDKVIEWQDVTVKAENHGYRVFATDFSTLPTNTQKEMIPGFWTVDCYRPLDTMRFGKWEDSQQILTPWKYGETGNGSVGKGLYQNVQGARLMYTPLAGKYGDMSLRILLDPAKTAAQGFGSADQYLDLCVKFDTQTLTGYGVRIIRTGEASDGVRFLFVQYDKGSTSYINEGVLTSCFLTGCEVILTVKENTLSVHAESEMLKNHASRAKYAPVVDMTIEITPNEFGGVAIQHTGTPGTGGWQNTTMLHNLEICWEMQK